MSPDAEELARRRKMVLAASEALLHANGLALAFQTLGSQLTACLSSLETCLALMTPHEKTVLTESLSGQFANLEPVIQRLQALAHLARPAPTPRVQ